MIPLLSTDALLIPPRPREPDSDFQDQPLKHHYIDILEQTPLGSVILHA